MLKIATPISSLFHDKKYAEILMENSDCLEVRDKSIGANYPYEELFHCDMQPIHRLNKKKFEYLQKIKDTCPELKLITFHCASSCDEPYIEKGMFHVSGNRYKQEDLFEHAKHNFSRIKEIFGKDIKVGIENNNYYPTEAYEYITDPEFISEIVHENNLYFLFDIAHAKITSHNKNINYGKYINELPFDRVIQLHISSYAISNGLAYDIHDYPCEEEFDEVKNIISTYDVEYLTVEYYNDIENLVTSLQKIKEIIDGFHRTAF